MNGHYRRVPCNLCSSTDLVVCFQAQRSGEQVVRCKRCGLMFYNPQPDPELALTFYSQEYFAKEFPLEERDKQIELAHGRLARIEQELGGVGRLLDVGCGVGNFVSTALMRGWRAVGLDIVPAAIQDTPSVRDGVMLPGDLSSARPSDMPLFDVVTMWDVLEHLTDPLGDMRRIANWLRAGGLLVIQTQNTNAVTAVWMGKRWEQFVKYHLYHFSSRNLQMALERSGFIDIKIESSNGFPRLDGLAQAKPVVTSALGLSGTIRNLARKIRDALYVHCGYDPFNIMVAIARLKSGYSGGTQ
jgi:SAM-dependent methyltransferase